MIRDGVFEYRGYDIQLSGFYDGKQAWLWVAEVEGTDMMYAAAGLPEDDPEYVKHLVRNWIDRGMPNGGPSA
jgi:hypothetical protein